MLPLQHDKSATNGVQNTYGITWSPASRLYFDKGIKREEAIMEEKKPPLLRRCDQASQIQNSLAVLVLSGHEQQMLMES